MSLTIQFDDGNEWSARTEIWNKDFKSAPYIAIPTDQLEGLSAEQIGSRVLDCIETAELCHAVDFSREIVGSLDYYKNAPPDYILQWAEKFLPLLERYADTKDENRHAVIHAARDFLKARLERILSRSTPEHIKAERGKARSSYNDLFVGVGRRDGFKCAACGSTDLLQLDHIVSVAYSGKTELDNLQLLCRPCNIRKGDKTVDYRPSRDEIALEGEQ